jgi:hypothetical protein
VSRAYQDSVVDSRRVLEEKIAAAGTAAEAAESADARGLSTAGRS